MFGLRSPHGNCQVRCALIQCLTPHPPISRPLFIPATRLRVNFPSISSALLCVSFSTCLSTFALNSAFPLARFTFPPPPPPGCGCSYGLSDRKAVMADRPCAGLRRRHLQWGQGSNRSRPLGAILPGVCCCCGATRVPRPPGRCPPLPQRLSEAVGRDRGMRQGSRGAARPLAFLMAGLRLGFSCYAAPCLPLPLYMLLSTHSPPPLVPGTDILRLAPCQFPFCRLCATPGPILIPFLQERPASYPPSLFSSLSLSCVSGCSVRFSLQSSI